jgi:hypothetical protein
MVVSSLPAVIAATSSDGIFTKAARKPFIHPNLGLARRILQDGKVPIDQVPFLKSARTLSTYQFQNPNLRNLTGGIAKFDRVFVIDTQSDFIITFGSYLVIDEDTLKSPYYQHVVAHELAHLNNGDSYVKAALWFLGKGWMQEVMNPFGMNARDPDADARAFGWHGTSIASSLISGRWLEAGAKGTMYGATLVGRGVRGLEAEAINYFREWDIKADAVAERWMGVLQYQSYLHVAEEVTGKKDFDASASYRLQESRRRQQPVITVVPQQITRQPIEPPIPKKPENPLLVLYVFLGGIAFIAVLFYTVGFILDVMKWLGHLSIFG